MSNIPEKMKALVAYAPGDYRLEMVPTPRATGDEVIIKVEGCGVCAGDVKAYHGAARFWGGEGNPPYIKAPVIPGHEFVGIVVEVGPDQKEFQVGDRVVSDQIVPCWECKFCKTGRYWMCQKHDVYGFQNNVNGGMAEYMRLPHGSLKYKVPKDLPVEKALLIEPYACSKHCVDRANIGNEDFVVLSGAGTLGLGMVGAIRKRNPATLVVLDMNNLRLQKAKEFGADIVLNPREVNVVEKIMEMTDGYGCDIYIEATGHPSSVKQGLEMIRKMGTFVEFSVFGELTTVDWSIISDTKELNLFGAHLSPYCYESVIKWIADGSLPTDGVVTHKFSLDDWKKAFEIAGSGADNSIKVAIIPGM
ncbi:alcohol dehydrogenase catalytic domain-containing protein [Thermoclostridium caenicola]|uniref:Threonine dehydrogenase n=1 Tax=Thermoclostridium caenicola TaxID=659425 RepID=A0A1M6D2I1_9FIRM|nr:alcohol dehydrogenase catalytic domain-containing protein [Thermoclostridium caenicola]SHI67284.1 Threonine dehydrogenase [Thermoclostridium caenicola]HOL85132.1 alcohol dehydrogenase catalytic domain-containing protein [Thermoclostridium caenicola]